MNKFCSFCKSAYQRAKVKFLTLLAVFGLVSVCHAEGESASNSYDLTIVHEIGTRLETTLQTFWSNNATVIYISVGLIVATALVWMVVRFFLKGTRRA